MTRPDGQRGLTLVEVMIAVAISAGIGAVMVGAFQRAQAARELVEQQDERTSGARVALGRVARELSMAFLSEHYDRGRFRDRPTVFRGREDSLLFTTMSHERLVRDARESDQAVVEYALDADPDDRDRRALFRREKPRIDGEPDRGGSRAVVCRHVASLSLQYWDWRKQEWAREWDAAALEHRGMLPTRVRVRLTLRMPDGTERPYETQARIAIVRPLDF